MPTIIFNCPKLNDNQKKEAVKRFTEVGSEITGIKQESFVVYIEEKDPGNVGVGGKLLKNRQQ